MRPEQFNGWKLASASNIVSIMAKPWSKHEVELIVQEYFTMLQMELSGEGYSKSMVRRQLLQRLNERSDGSIEFKHQNISAVLVKYGQPYIFGYKPRFNYQLLLEEMVLSYLAGEQNLSMDFESFVETVPERKGVLDFSKLKVSPPLVDGVQEEEGEYTPLRLNKPNYLKQEQHNIALGERGEDLIVQYEKWRLIEMGKENLSDRVEWISKDQGDGAGFDILSKNKDGSDRYIEVKTTKLGDRVPIYFSRNELKFSQTNSKDYYLYRVFNFYRDPKFFIKNGSFDGFCHIEPTNYEGRF